MCIALVIYVIWEVAGCTCQIEMWGLRCDFHVGVILWSVEAFHNHAPSLPVVLLKSLNVRSNICAEHTRGGGGVVQ